MRKPGAKSQLVGTSNGEVPVWLYIGGLLAVYGVLLTGAGIYQLSHPPQTVLAEYHGTLWAGLVMLALGIVYLFMYWPRRR